MTTDLRFWFRKNLCFE